MDIQMMPPGLLKPYFRNPRNNDRAVDAVAESIRRFGFLQPVVVDADLVIVAGHTRHRAALAMDLSEIPVLVALDLDEEKAKAFRIADNKVAEVATWNLEALNQELSELLQVGMDMQPFFVGESIEELLAGVTQQDAKVDLEVPELKQREGVAMAAVVCPHCGSEHRVSKDEVARAPSV